MLAPPACYPLSPNAAPFHRHRHRASRRLSAGAGATRHQARKGPKSSPTSDGGDLYAIATTGTGGPTARPVRTGYDAPTSIATRRSNRVDPHFVRAGHQVESDFNPRCAQQRCGGLIAGSCPRPRRQYERAQRLRPEENIRGGIRTWPESSGGHLRRSPSRPTRKAGDGAVAKYRGVPPYERDHDLRQARRSRLLRHALRSGPSTSRSSRWAQADGGIRQRRCARGGQCFPHALLGTR